ncbi:zinc finger protein OZF-like isoform X2 [Onthophagus taurus]|uniref:zinc finger protein OZF-like isoform X2 n=1 Tax=Onthophagus taurus TaxID=166361 RepID=UPI000C1FE9DA|nr:oocyte zinc finger protein XlCOF6.1-like isoform X2 [Onthophagus taurus]
MSERCCRLCLNPSSGSYKDLNDQNYLDQFKLVIPEDLMLTESPMICLNCSNLLLTAYTFKRNCLETEDKLKLLISTSSMEEKMQEDIFNQKEELSDDNFFDDSIKDEPNESDYDLESKMDIQMIEGQDIKLYICKFCGKKFSSHRSWYTHFKHHTGRRFNCEICSEGFDKRSDFINHKQSHRGMNKCPICGKIFLYKAVLDRHIKQHNNLCEKQVFECNVCGLQTKLKCKLMEHMRIHTGERPFKCLFCNKTFTQSSTLSTHVKGVHSKERPFTCEICGRSYAVRGQYTAHIRTHSADIPKNCVCSYCGKSFRIESKLQAHIKTHTGEKPIVCHVCSKRFSELNGLKKHMRTHTGEKPYECVICQKRFSQKYNMTIHYKSCLKRKTLST